MMTATNSEGRKNSRQQAREDSHNRILEAARKVFAIQGYGSTSLDAVAREAGCTKGLVVHYFGGKKKLWQAVVDYYTALAEASEFIQLNQTADMPGIEAFLKRTFRFFQTHPDYTQIANRVSADGDIPIPGEMSRLLQEAGRAFQQAQDNGSVRADIDARHAHLMTYSLIASWFTYRKLFQQAWALDPADEHKHDQAYFEDMLKMLRRGLAPNKQVNP